MCMLSNEVVARAKSLVHHNVLDKLDEVSENVFESKWYAENVSSSKLFI